jgi:P-type Mg2+ transporter
MMAPRKNVTSLYERIALLLGAKPSRSDTRESGIAISNEIVALSHEDRETVLRLLGSSPEGLDVSEASARVKTIGPNLITQEERPNILRELGGRAKNPLNGLLLSLAFASYLLGDLRAAIVIAIMVALAIATAFIQEHRSNDAAAKLRA